MLFNNKIFKFFDINDPGDSIAKAITIEDLEKVDVSKEPIAAPDKDTAPDTSKETVIPPSAPEEKPEDKEALKVEAPEKIEETPKPEQVTPDKDTAKTDTLVLSDEILSKMPEDKRRVLEKYKGKTFEEINEALYNSQIQIGKLANDRNKEQKQQLFKPTPKEEIIPETKEYKENLIINRTKKYLPEGVEPPLSLDRKSPEFAEWIREFNLDHPVEAREFMDGLKAESQKVEEIVQLRENVETNYDKILDGQQGESVSTIQKFFKDNFKIDELKEFGYDFTPNEKGDIPIMDKLLFDEDGNPDRKMLLYEIDGVPLKNPVLNVEAIATKFVSQFIGTISAEKEKRLTEKIRREQYQKNHKEPEQLNPSFGDKTQQKKGITELDIDKITSLEEMAQIEQKFESLK